MGAAGDALIGSLAGLEDLLGLPSAVVATTLARRLAGWRIETDTVSATVAGVNRVVPARAVTTTLRHGPAGARSGRVAVWQRLDLELVDVRHRGRPLRGVDLDLTDVAVVIGSSRVHAAAVAVRARVGVDELGAWSPRLAGATVTSAGGELVVGTRRLGGRVGAVVTLAVDDGELVAEVGAVRAGRRSVGLPRRLRRREPVPLRHLPAGLSPVAVTVGDDTVEMVLEGTDVTLPVDMAGLV
ncbi:MAG: hypothetical protein D6683_13780 [Actinomyces sp.]|nr:MAG: hypothetical protein D6683_13780 [Actinomyces sp.]